MENLIQINWLAVPVGGILSLVLGGIWYGPIAGKAWMDEMGMTREEIEASGSPTAAMVKSFIASMVLTIGLAMVFNAANIEAGDWLGGAGFGAMMGVLVVGAATFPNYAFEDKTPRHFLIHIGYTTILMAAIGAMLAAWR